MTPSCKGMLQCRACSNATQSGSMPACMELHMAATAALYNSHMLPHHFHGGTLYTHPRMLFASLSLLRAAACAHTAHASSPMCSLSARLVAASPAMRFPAPRHVCYCQSERACACTLQVGLNVGRLEVNGQSMVFWDLGGQTGLRSIWDKYYDESHAVVFVVDAAK